MTKIRDKKVLRKIRKRRSGLVRGTPERLRVVCSKSDRYLRVQVIDDTIGHTLLYFSTADNDFSEASETSYSRKNKYYAKKLGKKTALALKKKGIKEVVADRNGLPYHGNFKVFCEEMREQGINF